MSTNWVSKKEITRKWFIINAEGLVLGRLSSYIAFHLMGKHKVIYSPNLDCGDNFIVNNANYKIIPGQLMTVKIIYDEINQIGVPESAVTIQGKKAFVYIVRGEIAEKRDVVLGKRNFGKVSVLSGIDLGDKVIVEGISKVRDKSKVKVIKILD